MAQPTVAVTLPPAPLTIQEPTLALSVEPSAAEQLDRWILLVADRTLQPDDIATLVSPVESSPSVRVAVLFLTGRGDQVDSTPQATRCLGLIADALDRLPHRYAGPVEFLTAGGRAVTAVSDAASSLGCEAVVVSRRSPVAAALLRHLLVDQMSRRATAAPALTIPAVLLLN